MATTFQAIASTTVGAGGAANITFSNIPQTYTDLVISFSARSNNTSAGGGLYESIVTRINGSTSTADYTSLGWQGSGSGGLAQTKYVNNVSWIMPGIYTQAANAVANAFSNITFYLTNYTSAIPKVIVGEVSNENNITNQVVVNGIVVGRYAPTTAVTSISFAPEYGTAWVQYSTATLYGIKSS